MCEDFLCCWCDFWCVCRVLLNREEVCMWQAPLELVTVNEWQQLSRRTLSATLTACVCVCVCKCVCWIQEKLQPKLSHWGHTQPSSLLSSLPQPTASFFPLSSPQFSCCFFVHDSPYGFLLSCRTALS